MKNLWPLVWLFVTPVLSLVTCGLTIRLLIVQRRFWKAQARVNEAQLCMHGLANDRLNALEHRDV